MYVQREVQLGKTRGIYKEDAVREGVRCAGKVSLGGKCRTMNGKRKDSEEEETGGGIHRIGGEKYRSDTINKEKTSNTSESRCWLH
jgi:hypothetical protein